MFDDLRARAGIPKRARKNDCARWRASTGLNRFEKRIFSQNGEDGLIEAIFACLGTRSKTFVEFGVEDGRECNTALLTRMKGWSGAYIEADPLRFARLERYYRGFPVRTINAKVTRENVARVFASSNVPEEPDLLSIDIDGNDYWVWESLEMYRPLLTIVEFNLAYPPPARWVMEYDPDFVWDDTSYFGASLASLHALGARKGYELVAVDCNMVNAFFVRADLLPAGDLHAVTPEDVFHFPPRFPSHPYRPGPSVAV
jgi:hypothetical protein